MPCHDTPHMRFHTTCNASDRSVQRVHPPCRHAAFEIRVRFPAFNFIQTSTFTYSSRPLSAWHDASLVGRRNGDGLPLLRRRFFVGLILRIGIQGTGISQFSDKAIIRLVALASLPMLYDTGGQPEAFHLFITVMLTACPL